jgi:predicted transcriptional regulator
MVTRPAVHGASITVGELRQLFDDDHIHMALLVRNDELVGAVERADLSAVVSNATPAREIAALNGRTIGPDAALSEAITAMKRSGRRRLAVTTEDGRLLGLLCLKASGRGFCSDADVAARRGALLEQSGRNRGRTGANPDLRETA